MAIQSWGIPALTISEVSKTPIPDNLYNEMDARANKITVAG